MKICIVGLGLLGGSFALGLKNKIKNLQIIGVDINEEHVNTALELGIIDEKTSFDQGVQQATLTVLATPVHCLLTQIPQALDLMPDTSILTDLGSTKSKLCKVVETHPKRNQYIALHPIAGTENSGPEAAFADLLKNKIMIVCDREKSNPQAFMTIELLCSILDMELHYMSSEAHDRHLAYVSHLSHIISFALSSTVLDKEKDEQSIFEMAGSGFASTVRLAKSSPAMWAPIFQQNQKNISEALGSYIAELQRFKEIIDTQNIDEAKILMQKANGVRRILDGLKK